MDKDLEKLIKRVEQEKGIKINLNELKIPTITQMDELFTKFGSHLYDDEWSASVSFINFKKGYYLAEILKSIEK